MLTNTLEVPGVVTSAATVAPMLNDPQGALVEQVLNNWVLLRQLFDTYGHLIRIAGNGREYLFICDPSHVRDVLSQPRVFTTTEKESFPFRCPASSAIQRLARGITWMNGLDHQRHRQMMNPAYARGHVEVYRDVVLRLVEEQLATWREGEERNLREDVGRLALLIAFELLYGMRVVGEGGELCRLVQGYCQALDSVPHDATPASLGPRYHELLRQAEGVEAALLDLVRQRREAGATGEDVLSTLIRARDSGGAEMTDEELAAEALTLSIAGNSSVASTLSSVLLLLAQHPEWARCVAEELECVLHGAEPSVVQLSELKTLEAVIMESLRLLPTGLWGQREVAVDAAVGPCRVAAGTRVIYATVVTQRLPELYPEPYRFRPERWKDGPPPPYEYLAFGGGPRLCIGRALALLEIKLILAVLLQRYRLSVRPGARIDRYILTPGGSPMPMVVHGRDGRFTREWIQGNILYLVDLR